MRPWYLHPLRTMDQIVDADRDRVVYRRDYGPADATEGFDERQIALEARVVGGNAMTDAGITPMVGIKFYLNVAFDQDQLDRPMATPLWFMPINLARILRDQIDEVLNSMGEGGE